MSITSVSYDLIIIGSGPAGLTAALYTSRAFIKTLVIEGSKPGGQLMGTTLIENWPGTKSILGPELMMLKREHAEHYGTQFASGSVLSVDFTKKPFSVTTSQGKTFQSHAIIIATGASPHTLKCPGEQEYWGKGVSTCAVCDGAFYVNKKVVIVGGGDTAMEQALFMTKFTQDITIVHLLDKLTASPLMQNRVLEKKSITIIYSSTISKINGNGSQITSLEIINQKNQNHTKLPADALFLAIGSKPNTQAFQGAINLNNHGYVVVEDHTKTSCSGVFVAGDVADYRYRQAIVSAGAGCMAALDAQRYLEQEGHI